MQIVLQGSPCEQESVPRVKLAETLRNLGLFVLDLVCFVHYQIFPLKFHYLGHAEAHALKSGQHNVKLARLHLVFQDVFAFGLRCDQVQNTNLRTPLFKLFLPVRNDSLGHDHYEVILDFLELSKESQKSNCLDSFSQSLQTTRIAAIFGY